MNGVDTYSAKGASKSFELGRDESLVLTSKVILQRRLLVKRRHVAQWTARRRDTRNEVLVSAEGLDTVAGIRRLLDIVVTDGVGLENGIPRLRALIATAVAAMNLPAQGRRIRGSAGQPRGGD